ncbi:hypothetical protein EJ06DRAFT_558618 [Trichodelitschia bisporula]|uniref:Zn(2)-C6 fungal-type domain-containing protein n=1 Tax=Trichodelitschia bisporula TaxID=703511 RepID=A0A6G1HQH1_9PEZI|nr:hypothetical protein EJ06DRAFT_558618 [Trichodelitschia bisporula]
MSRQPSPESSSEWCRKKRRTFACHACRRKKVRCDRVYPVCGRCRYFGQSGHCVYDSKPSDASESAAFSYSVPPDTPSDRLAEMTDLVVQQSQRIKELESRVAHLELDSGRTSPIERDCFFQNSGSDSRFGGPSAPLSIVDTSLMILTSFPELAIFMSDPTGHSPALLQARSEAWQLKPRLDYARLVAAAAASSSLTDLLPDQAEVARLTAAYWEHLEQTTRVLHAPTFWAAFRAFENGTRSEPFVVVLLLVMAAASCMARPVAYIGISPVTRERAVTWINACAAWLAGGPKLAVREELQIRLLILVARQANGVPKLWEEAASLLNDALAAGLHVDGGRLEKTFSMENAATGLPGVPRAPLSVFEKEIRRRLWASIAELELQEAFDRGMPSSAAAMASDCGPPANVSDDDFHQLSADLPSPKMHTRMAYLHTSHRSFRLRVALNKAVNDPTTALTYNRVLAYDAEVTKELEQLPKDIPRVAALQLNVQLRQFLLPLHVPFARRTTTNPRYAYSRMACVNAASAILQLHADLETPSANIMREDVFRAALTLCHNIVLWKALSGEPFMNQLGGLFLQQVEKAIELIEEKIIYVGQHWGQIWFAVAGQGILRTAVAPQFIESHMQDITSRLAKLFYKVLAAQEVDVNRGRNAPAVFDSEVPHSEDGPPWPWNGVFG